MNENQFIADAKDSLYMNCQSLLMKLYTQFRRNENQIQLKNTENHFAVE